MANPKGFTIIELVVVLAGLGILSSLATSNVIKYLDYAKVDEAKTLLNKAAAECLQEFRRDPVNAADRELFNAKDKNKNDLPDILSEERLESTGYRFSSDHKRCGNTSISAISPDDSSRRYPGLSFVISDGVLIKCATNDGSETEASAKSWAGNCVSKGKELIEWQEYDASIRQAEKKCKEDLNQWLSNESNRGKYNKAWNEQATSQCPQGPPKIESEFCTPNGCNQTIYGYKGSIVSTGDTPASEKEYDDYVEIQKGKDCADALKALREANTHTSADGIPVDKCDGDVYWYYRGDEVSAETWASEMCNENKQKLLSTTHSGPVDNCGTSDIYICGGKEIIGANAKANFDECLANDKNAICTSALNNDAVKRSNGGPYTSPTPSYMSAPIGEDCNIQYWYCGKSRKIYRGKEDYDADEACKIRDCGDAPSRNCNKPKFYTDLFCYEYSDCMGRL